MNRFVPIEGKVTAIIVVRNGERFLADALQSIAAQSRQPDELIIVDGQSTDRTPEIAQAFPGVRYLLQEDLGIANARNLAIRTATGDFIAFLDADDMWTPDKLQVQLAFMQANPHPMYTTTLLRLFYEPGTPPRPGFQEEGFTRGIEGRFPGTMLAHRAVFDQVGPFDPAFSVAFELDWFARAQDMNVPSALVEKVLLHKRIHAANNAIQREQFRRESFVVMQRSLLRKRALTSTDKDSVNAYRTE
ncbi:MAG: glycosyltransferase family 2 protein [Caldilineaceae bacterium]|nr:glycosyltransferase family 2 protein [Caldilineaceae bacterium]